MANTLKKWWKKNKALGFGVVSGLLTGVVHFVAHNLAGNPSAFESAGVMTAGISVIVISGIYTAFAVSRA